LVAGLKSTTSAAVSAAFGSTATSDHPVKILRWIVQPVICAAGSQTFEVTASTLGFNPALVDALLSAANGGALMPRGGAVAVAHKIASEVVETALTSVSEGGQGAGGVGGSDAPAAPPASARGASGVPSPFVSTPSDVPSPFTSTPFGSGT
jgi:hypothetical protein